MKIQYSREDRTFYLADYLIVTLLLLIVLYPLVFVVSASLSDPNAVSAGKVILWPVGFSLESYKALLGDNRILLYYWNTIKYAAVGTFIMLLTTSLMAYPLSIPALRGRKLISVILTITMFFGGGLIPYYVTIMRLKLIDTFWVMVLPGAISAYNVIVFKTFFMSIPESLKESAFLDGAGHLRVLFSIVLPLSKAVLATFALFSIVGYWNDYFSSIIYIRNNRLWPMQTVLRQVLQTAQMNTMMYDDAKKGVAPETMKDAMIVVTMIPILCVYPFVQKYFVKGVMVGSLKG